MSSSFSLLLSHDNIAICVYAEQRKELISKRLERLCLSFRSSCTNERNECGLHTQRHFVSSPSLRSLLLHSLSTIRCAHYQSLCRSCSISVLLVDVYARYARMFVLFNRCLISLLFLLGRDLSSDNVIVVEYNNEQSILGIEKKCERAGRNLSNTTIINDAKMTTRIILFLFLFCCFDF